MTGCNSTNTSCVIHNLVCGSIYNISVLAIGYQCNVSRSEITTLHSGWWPLIKHNTMQFKLIHMPLSASISYHSFRMTQYQFPFCPQCHVFPPTFRQTWAVDLVWLMCPGSLAKELSLILLSLRAAGVLRLHATAVALHVSLVIYCVDSHTASAWLPLTMCVQAHRVIAYSWTQVGWLHTHIIHRYVLEYPLRLAKYCLYIHFSSQFRVSHMESLLKWSVLATQG